MEPIVSIVMPTFNRMEFLPAAVESVLRQKMPDWQLISIADDGSNAQTLDYLDSLTRDERIRGCYGCSGPGKRWHCVERRHRGGPSRVAGVSRLG